MQTLPELVLNSLLLGVGLAMDAFSISLANGLREPDMPRGRMALIAGVFGGFQTLMPLIGWVCVRTILETFQAAQAFIPWIALGLLGFIGGKMLWEGWRGGAEAVETDRRTGLSALLLQGVATSIDALSAGFAMAELSLPQALLEVLLIGGVTFLICCVGLKLGRKAGEKLADRASILGGLILIGIGIEIFVTHVF